MVGPMRRRGRSIVILPARSPARSSARLLCRRQMTVSEKRSTTRTARPRRRTDTTRARGVVRSTVIFAPSTSVPPGEGASTSSR